MEDRGVFSVISRRHSVRSYSSRHVTDDDIALVLEAARWAPSGGNGQDWAFGVVRQQAKKEALARAAGGQAWVATAPVILALCSRVPNLGEMSAHAYQVNELRWGPEAMRLMTDSKVMPSMSLLLGNGGTAIPGTHITLAAAALGIGTCWIGHLDISMASQILELPPDWRCYFLITLGYEEARGERRGRKDLSNVCFDERWNNRWAPADGAPVLGTWGIREYQTTDEQRWLDTWGRTAVTSGAWVLLHHEKPRYSRPSIELVSHLHAEILGFIDVEIEVVPGELGLLTHSRCGFVWELGVRPDWQRRGIARALIETARARLDALGVKRMEFWSAEPHSQQFYKHVGMTEIGRHYQFFARLPEHMRQQMQSDGYGFFFCYGSCDIGRFGQLREHYREETAKPFATSVCVGHSLEWSGC